MMKNIKINRHYDKRGNSYATKDEQCCLDIICKKLKINLNPSVHDDDYMKQVMNFISVKAQVKKQYDCNKRLIEFKIDI